MKPLHYSLATAAIAGLLAGGVMKLGPDALADRPGGPQILVSTASKRVVDNNGWYADTQLIGHNGEIADYVLGTDWTSPASYDAAVVDYGHHEYEPLPEEQPVEVVEHEAAAEAAAPEPVVETASVSYPSMNGDILGGLSGWPPPAQVDVSDESDTITS